MNRFLIVSLIVFLSVLCLSALAGKEAVSAQNPSDSNDILVAQSGANLIVEDIVIRKRADMNFRVRVKNIGSEAARKMKGNLQIFLSVKDRNSGEWILLKKWENIDKILPGQTVSRDYFASASEDPNLKEKSFTLKAAISFKAPKGITISKESITRSYPEDAVADP